MVGGVCVRSAGGRLDLLPFEAAFTVELAFAVERYGLIPTLQRVTNTRYVEAA